MSGDTGFNIVYALGCLLLVGSALAARRMPIMQGVKMALTWLAIFSVVYVLFLFRGEGQEVWRRITADIAGNRGVQFGSILRIPTGDDGHFHVIGQINGQDVEFLVDSGASVTTLSPEVASAVGVEPDGGPAVPVTTANGIAMMQPARAARFKIGTIERRGEHVQISAMANADNLLGMSFLSSLKSWKVDGDLLTLEP